MLGHYHFSFMDNQIILIDNAIINVGNTFTADQFEITIQGNENIIWTADVTSGQSWLSLSSGNIYSGSSNVHYNCLQNNSSSQRTGTIRLESNEAVNSPVEVTIIQDATLQETGSLQVTIVPQGAIDSGATWRVDSGNWQNSSVVLSDLSAVSHTVEFSSVTGVDGRDKVSQKWSFKIEPPF